MAIQETPNNPAVQQPLPFKVPQQYQAQQPPVGQPVQQMVEQPEKKSHWKTWLIVILILIIAAGAGYYFFLR